MGAVAGNSPARDGMGFPVIVNARFADTPPPGAGVITVTAAELAVVRSAAVIVAVSWVGLT